MSRPKLTKHGRRLKDKAEDASRRRRERKEKGLCVDCGDHPAESGSPFCAIHKAQRAETAKRNYHRKRLKDAGVAEHEYDLRVQLTGGKCEGRCGRPHTHFNLCPQTGKLRMLLCWKCNQIAILCKDGGEAVLMQLASRLASFTLEEPMKVIMVKEEHLPLVHTALARGSERLNT